MSTTLKLVCNGCGDEAETAPIKKHFVSLTGKSYGFGHIVQPNIDDVIPNGWMWSDPYTFCTYCPKCWAQITKK